MPSSRQVGRIAAFDAAGEERIFDLQVGDGVSSVGAADGVDAGLGQPHIAHVAGLDEVADGADGFLDRHVRVDPAWPVDIDVVGVEALQGVGEERLHCRRAAVIAEPGTVGAAQGPELDADHDLVAPAAGQRLGDEHLVVAHAVVVAGVEEGDPGVDGSVDGGDAFGAVSRTVEVRHPHAAEADGRNHRAVLSKPACEHRRD